MGTQVQPKSYFSVFHPIRDLNEEMNCNRSLTYEDRAFNGKIYDIAKLTVLNDKDMLKRTMLEHEAVFRKQVYELHRLYQVQKELMDELKKKKLYKFSLPPGHSDNRPLNFLKQENLLHSSSQTVNGGSLEDDMLLNSKSKKIPRKVFDLHLPADAYIESEDAEETEKQIVAESSFRSLDPPNMIYDAEPENSIKLTLGNSGNPIPIQGSRRSSIRPQKDLSVHNLTDLNKPVENLFGEDQEFSKSSYSCGMKTYNKENEGQFNLKPSTNSVHKDFFIPMHSEELSSSNFSEVDKEEGQKWSCLDKGAGQNRRNVNSLSSGFSCGKSPMSCKSIQIQLNKAHEVSLDNEDRDKAIHSVENSQINMHLVNSGHSRAPAPQMTHSFSVVSQSSINRTVSPPGSWRNPRNKISHIPIAVQALPCFNESTESKSTSANVSHAGDSSGKLQIDGDVRSRTKFGSKSSYKNGHEHGNLFDINSSVHLKFHPFILAKPDINNRGDNSVYENSVCHEHQKYLRNSHCTNIKFPDDVNLNQIIQTGQLNGLDTQSNRLVKHADSLKDILMFRTNPAESTGIEEMCFSRSSHSISSCEKVVSGFVREENKWKRSSLHSLLHSQSSSEVKKEKLQKNRTFDSLNNGVMGLTFLDNISQSVNCLPSCQEQSLSDGVFARCNGRGTGARSDCLHFQNDMNVNAGKEKVPSPLPVPSVAPKPTCQIDLEAPTDALKEDHIYCEGEIVGMKYDEKTVQMYSTKKDGLRETELSHDTTLQAAAETIVSLSSYSFSSFFEINTQHATTTSSSSLQWFAEIVTCNADYGGVQNVTADNGIKPSDNDGLDLFESMTLKLEEMKVDEYMCKPSRQENQIDQDIGSAALLLTKPRRVQARKRRQRRDFQKDILPGLASLSRHEVTEDLQILGGLTRSLGKSPQTVSARRAAGRNGVNCQPRGRRQPRTLAISVAEIHVNTMPTLPSPADTGTKGRNIMAWGRTTRRCRRQRLPSDHISAPQC